MARVSDNRSRGNREVEQVERAYRSTSGSRRRTRKSSKKQQKSAIAAICIAITAILICIVAGCVFLTGGDDNGLILNNVTVAGIDVGGMSKADAISAVTLATNRTYTEKDMVIKVLEQQVTLSPADTGARLDVAGAVDAAYAYGRTGSAAQKAQEQLTASTVGYAVDLVPHLSLDTDAITGAVNEMGSHFSSMLKQTTYEITGKLPSLTLDAKDEDGQVLVIQVGTPELSLDLDALYQQVLDAFNANVFLVEGSCETIEPDELDLDAIYAESYIAPENAKLDEDTFEVLGGSYGYGFDLAAAKAMLSEAEPGQTLNIPFSRIDPETGSDELSDLLFRDELGKYTASAESDSNRDVNLRLACEAINGIVLYPGDIFSYNETLGERTEAKGYKPGPSYAGNETVDTIGGGICQVSSALYYCTLLADLKTVTRDCHGFATEYMPLGMDAVVSWGSLDFKFRNSTNYPIRIEASASGGSVTVRITGTDEKDFYVKMEYKILNTYNYKNTYQSMAANNTEGYANGDVIVEGYTGYDVEVYKCKYNKETDALITRDYVDSSNYRSRDAVICVIESSSSAPSDPVETTTPGISGSVSDGGGALPDE